MRRSLPFVALASLLAFSGCSKQAEAPKTEEVLAPASAYTISDADKKLIAQLYPGVEASPTGLYSIIRQPGSGTAKPKYGTLVTMNYEIHLLNGPVLESTALQGKPFQVPIGVGRVIRGWDEAVMEMTKGEKRTLIIPHYLAYGVTGNPPKIPPYATIVFEVELVDFK